MKETLTTLQSELREIRPGVIELLEAMPKKQVEVNDKIICLTTKQRTIFDKKKALEKLGKVLKPFFRTQEYSEITILGEIEEEEAA